MNKKKKSMTQRLQILLVVCIVPATIMVSAMLFLLNDLSRQYDRIVSNITEANVYNLDFKEEIDYIMYIVVVNSERASELIDVDKPYKMIDEARTAFKKIQNNAPDGELNSLLTRITKSFDNLKTQVREIQEDAQVVGNYDSNLERLDLDIRVTTELIQDMIQQYISIEADNLSMLRVSVRDAVNRAITGFIIVGVLILILAAILSSRIMSRLTDGISQLRIAAKKAGRGDFSVRTHLEDSDEELSELGEGFNQMVERLSTLVEDIKVEQLNLRLTEQKLLQAQINPHFLYNTLDAIIWLAESGEKDQVVEMVTALSDFFRTTLSKGRDFITVEEEKSHIQSYLQIQQFRYQDILEYSIDIDDSLYPCQILKLTLQPLVENALYHGIKNKRGLGRIEVTGRDEGETMRFVVRDNGIGMTEEKLKQVRRDINPDVRNREEPEGFGLYNVAQRIRLNYGPAYDISLQSTPGEGTEIIIILPKN